MGVEMNARIETLDVYAGGEFLIYLDDDIFFAASQHKSPSDYSSDQFKWDLDRVGELCRMMHGLGAEQARPEYRTMLPLQRRFEVVAQTYPGAPAVRCGARTMTYGELDVQADALALHLQDLGLTAGSFCLLDLKPSVAQLRVILAIVKAGCAYLQLDPSLPSGHAAAVLAMLRPRIRFVHDDAPDSSQLYDLPFIECSEEAEELPYGWPDEADVRPGTPASAFATVSAGGGVCMWLRTHRSLVHFPHTLRGANSPPAGPPVHFWKVLSEGAVLTIPPRPRVCASGPQLPDESWRY